MRLLVRDVYYNIARAGEGAPLVLLHGFTGSVASWQSHIPIFANHFSILALDFLGHGKSDAPTEPTRYRIECCVADLVEILDQLEIGRAHVLGYSMGGRVALHFAHAYPGRIEKLILESASPGIENETERAARTVSDARRAEKIEREGVEKFVEEWANLPLFATQARLPETVRENLKQQRLQNRADGLANSLRGLSVGAQASLWDQLPNIRVPTLLLAGQLDPKFSAIAQRMADAMPNARLEIVHEAGHTVHLEQPARFDELVLNFLTEI